MSCTAFAINTAYILHKLYTCISKLYFTFFLRQKIKRFGHMQPQVIKYQAKKETQVPKSKFCKMYSDIKNKRPEVLYHPPP